MKGWVGFVCAPGHPQRALSHTPPNLGAHCAAGVAAGVLPVHLLRSPCADSQTDAAKRCWATNTDRPGGAEVTQVCEHDWNRATILAWVGTAGLIVYTVSLARPAGAQSRPPETQIFFAYWLWVPSRERLLGFPYETHEHRKSVGIARSIRSALSGRSGGRSYQRATGSTHGAYGPSVFSRTGKLDEAAVVEALEAARHFSRAQLNASASEDHLSPPPPLHLAAETRSVSHSV